MREYETTHPWITFELPKLACEWKTWLRFGEAHSKCQHLAGVPLKPLVAQSISRVYLVKGVHATTAIEGNTLSEEEVGEIVAGKRAVVPPSLEYQETEVRNVLNAVSVIDAAMEDGVRLPLTPGRICELNLRVLDGTELEPGVIPGRLREASVTVGQGRYRGAPAQDVRYLVDRLCEWLNGPQFVSDDPEQQFALALTQAVMAHVYLAWVHPFGDGNGRTARLVEAQILSQSGLVPEPAINLLSDHYNRTRDRYYRLLDEASKRMPVGDLRPFLAYSAQGFTDRLREQIDRIREEQVRVAWINYVFEIMDSEPNTATAERRRKLVFDLDPHIPTPKSKIPELSGRLALMYAGKGGRTLTRDVNVLSSLGLIRKADKGWVANMRIIEAFLPPVFEPFPA